MDINKEFHYDFMCKDANGVMFIVELQTYWEYDWFQRCVCYSSRAYDRQTKKGEDYNVPPVYLIAFMGVNINHPDKSSGETGTSPNIPSEKSSHTTCLRKQ